jgi:predicted DNA binding CopG/RHH family protein
MDKESQLEEEILASFERGEWQVSPKGQSEIARFAAMASSSLAKDKRVNIRISSRDLDDLQAKAAEEAIPYQTLMASVLNKYVTGRLVEPQTDLPPRLGVTRQKRRIS